MATIQTISNVLKEIQAAYPNWKATEDTVKVWTIYLKDLDDEMLVTAVRKFISSADHAFPPSIPEIRSSVTGLMSQINKVPNAYEAWAEVIGAEKPKKLLVNCDVSIDPRGWTFQMISHKWSHPIVKKCAERFGWPNWPNGENEVADRAHFIKAYDLMLSEETRTATQLPVITEFVAKQRIELDRRAALETGERAEVQAQMRRLAGGMGG